MAEGTVGVEGRSHQGERCLAIRRSSTSSRQARCGGLAWNPPLLCRCCALAEPAFKKAGRNQIKRQGRRKTLGILLSLEEVHHAFVARHRIELVCPQHIDVQVQQLRQNLALEVAARCQLLGLRSQPAEKWISDSARHEPLAAFLISECLGTKRVPISWHKHSLLFDG